MGLFNSSAILCLLGASAALAEPLTDLHLDVVARTPAETGRIAAVTAPTTDFSTPERYEALSAGGATSDGALDRDAFSHPVPTLEADGALDFTLGHALFTRMWVTSPASTIASDGLGPLFNARSCDQCHVRDGRGVPPMGDGPRTPGLMLRVSVPAEQTVADIEGWISTAPEPRYGWQIQDAALPGLMSEGRMAITYTDVPVTLADGTVVTLRKPQYRLAEPAYGALSADAMISPRIAPPMIGLGLLEAIPTADILAIADPDDRDGDGVSGRPAVVSSTEFAQPMLGRFGWKGGAATVREQTAMAFAEDIGISSPLRPDPWGGCTAAQTDCLRAVHGDHPQQDGYEISDSGLALVTHYTQTLAVPPRRDLDAPQVLRGKAVFYGIGCIDCHTPKFVTHRLRDNDPSSFQLIWPYSDLLLHDMGAGLADHRPEGRATGREWKTPPLWGIGLTRLVTGEETYLHDGRARSLMEAILWHGGEAQRHRDAVIASPKVDRAALIAFLESL